MNEDQAKTTEPPAIWNPNAAANWCLIFTPAFGAYLHMLNWRTLGHSQRAAASQKWFYAAIALLGIFALSAVAFPDSKPADVLTRLLGLVFLLAWYFGSARSQAKFVKEQFGTSYSRKAWGKPLGLAVLFFLGCMAAVFVVALVIEVLR